MAGFTPSIAAESDMRAQADNTLLDHIENEADARVTSYTEVAERVAIIQAFAAADGGAQTAPLTHNALAARIVDIGSDGTELTIYTGNDEGDPAAHDMSDGDYITVSNTTAYNGTYGPIDVIAADEIRVPTTIPETAHEAAGYIRTSALRVASTAEFLVGQNVEVVNDDGQIHVTLIASLAPTRIHLQDAVPATWIGALKASAQNPVSITLKEVALARGEFRTLPERLESIGLRLGDTISVSEAGALGDGVTDDTDAFEDAILNSGRKFVHMSDPAVAYKLTRQIDVPVGMRIEGYSKKTIMDYYGAAGTFAFKFANIQTVNGGGMSNFRLNIRTAGALGIWLYQAKGTRFDNFVIDGKSIGAGGMFLDGGAAPIDEDTGEGTAGTTWNVITGFMIDAFTQYGIKLDTPNYWHPITSNAYGYRAAWCNRNFITNGYVQGRTALDQMIGIHLLRAGTNYITHVGVQRTAKGIVFSPWATYNTVMMSNENTIDNQSIVFESAWETNIHTGEQLERFAFRNNIIGGSHRVGGIVENAAKNLILTNHIAKIPDLQLQSDTVFPDVLELGVTEAYNSALRTKQGAGAISIGARQEFTRTATTTNASATLTLVSSFTNITVLDVITGAGIPAGTTVTALDPVLNTITMSAPATASAGGITITNALTVPVTVLQAVGGTDPVAMAPSGFRIGPSSSSLDQIEAFKMRTATWNPASVADGANTTTTVTVTGAVVGNICTQPGFSIVLPTGVFLSAQVTAADTVTVTLHNESGSTQDVASGTLRVGVLVH